MALLSRNLRLIAVYPVPNTTAPEHRPYGAERPPRGKPACAPWGRRSTWTGKEISLDTLSGSSCEVGALFYGVGTILRRANPRDPSGRGELITTRSFPFAMREELIMTPGDQKRRLSENSASTLTPLADRDLS